MNDVSKNTETVFNLLYEKCCIHITKGRESSTFKGYCRPCKQIFKMVSLGKGLDTYARLYSFVWLSNLFLF